MGKEMKQQENPKDVKKDDNNDDDAVVGRLSQDTLKYFQRVEQVLDDNVFDDEEHKETFMRNVFLQIETDGTHLARHSNKSSRIMEKIIPLLNAELFGKFTLLIQEEIQMLSCDRFSSHVIETLCKNTSTHIENDDISELFVSFCKKLRKHCSVLIRDTYGSHVLSTVLQVLSGVKVPDVVTKSQASRKSKKKGNKPKPKRVEDNVTEPVVTEVPRIFKKCFKKYVQVIQEDINFGELLCHRNASPVIQVLLLATSNVSEPNYQSLYTAIVSRGKLLELPESGGGIEDDDEFVYRLPVVFTDDVGSHLFEALIKSANDDQLHEMGEKCFKRCMLSLCIHPLGNYLAQTYLRCVKSIEHVDFFISRLLKYLEDILAAGSMGCVVRLAELISKFEKVEYQKKYITALSEALHIPENKKENPFCKLVMCMRTYELLYKTSATENTSEVKTDDAVKAEDTEVQTEDAVETDNTEVKTDGNNRPGTELEGTKNEVCAQVITNDDVNYHGCCILQHLFSFKKCRQVVESFIELSVKELKIFACNPHGSFTIEKFCSSEVVPVKSKVMVGELLLACTYDLACDKWGSRVIDCLFKAVDDPMQERFKYVLREFKSRLESNLYGRIVLYNCGVKQHVSTMREIQEQQQLKRKKLFEDILDEQDDKKEVPIVPPKKKKDDRAERYRKQLAALGISLTENGEDQKDDGNDENAQVDANDDAPDDLVDVLQAIEASAKQSGKKLKT